MSLEPTIHYQLEGPEADADWDALAPRKGIIHLGSQSHPFSIALFHELRCLDIFRQEILSFRQENSTRVQELSALSRHCLNYLRQTTLCRADMSLIAILGHHHGELFPDTYECKDWRRVYAALEDNQEQNRM